MGSGLVKAFFILCLLGIGFMYLFVSGLLPESVYKDVYQITDNLPIANQASAPYLEKFEGHWSFSFTPASAQSTLTDCPSFTTILTSHNGFFTGRAAIPSYLLGIEATTTDGGFMAGELYSASREYTVSFSGEISGAAGQGSWQDNHECSGKWTLMKLGDVVNPLQAKVQSVAGNVSILRNGSLEPAWPDEFLYAGDEIQVPSGGRSTIELGPNLKLVTVEGGTSYTVPYAGGIPLH